MAYYQLFENLTIPFLPLLLCISRSKLSCQRLPISIALVADVFLVNLTLFQPVLFPASYGRLPKGLFVYRLVNVPYHCAVL